MLDELGRMLPFFQPGRPPAWPLAEAVTTLDSQEKLASTLPEELEQIWLQIWKAKVWRSVTMLPEELEQNWMKIEKATIIVDVDPWHLLFLVMVDELPLEQVVDAFF